LDFKKDNLNIFFFFLLVFSFISGQLIRLDLFGVFVPLLDAAVFLFLSYQILTRRFSWKKYFAQKYLLIFIGTLIISNLVNFPKYSLAENFTGSLYLFRFAIYSLFLGVNFSVVTGHWPVTTNKLINIIGLIIASIGILQYVFLPDLRFLQYQNWDDHLGRLTFPFLDPSFAGAILLVFLICALFRRGLPWQTPTIIVVLLAIFLTFSRATWLVTGIIFFLILLKSQIERRIKFIILLSTLIICFIVGEIFQLSGMASGFKTRPYGNQIYRIETIESRLSSLEKGLTIWRQNPIFGVGFNSYKTYQLRNNFSVKNGADNRGEASVENSFVFVLTTSGILGFVSFLFWVINLHYLKGASFKGSGKYILLSILLGSLFNNLFFYPFILIILFLSPNLQEVKKV
jgi:O-antigen ligase